MEPTNGEDGINTHVYLFSSKADYEFILAGPVGGREALDSQRLGKNPGSVPICSGMWGKQLTLF